MTVNMLLFFVYQFSNFSLMHLSNHHFSKYNNSFERRWTTLADLISDFLNERVGVTFEPADASVTVDCTLVVICAIGTHPKLSESIIAQYNSKRSEYYQSYQASIWHNHNLINSYTTKQNHLLKMTAGIYAQNEATEDFSDIHRLIHKGYKFVWNYVKRHKVIREKDFNTQLVSKFYNGDVPSAKDFLYQNMILQFLCATTQIELILFEPNIEFIQSAITEFIGVICYQEAYFNDDEFRENENQMLGIINKNMMAPVAQTLYDFIVERQQWEFDNATDEYPNLESENIVNKSMKKPWSRASMSLTRWLDVVGVHHDELCRKTKFSKTEIQRFILNTVHAQKHSNIKDSEIEFHMLACMIIYALAGEYKETKARYFEESNEAVEEIENRLAKEYQKQKKKLLSENNTLLTEQSRLLHHMEELKKENYALRKENQEILRQAESNVSNTRELHALREYIHEKESTNQIIEKTPDNEMSMEECIKVLNTKKCAILGGHPAWIKRLKHILPTFQYISTDQLNVDTSFLDKQDFVFINTAYMSHAFYNKVMARLNQSDVPFFYLPSTNNVDRNIFTMFQHIEPMCNT